jgi:hypothetical protein
MDILGLLIPAVLIVACGYSSYKIGRADGAEALLEILHKKRIIAYDDKGNIKPNPFFLPED